ncbi:hypothetical protein OF83DRAFT_623591 [Amylostereum chailletii]|nr:hypothetical protein OF83DRAFT_623591 [Amylostereum chailletii]
MTSLAELHKSRLPSGQPTFKTSTSSFMTTTTTLSDVDFDPQPLGEEIHSDGSQKCVWDMGSGHCEDVWIVAKAFQELSKATGDFRDFDERTNHSQAFGVLLKHARTLNALAKAKGKQLSDLVIAHEVLLKAHAEVDPDTKITSKRIFFYRRPLRPTLLPFNKDWGYWSFNACPPGTRKHTYSDSLPSMSTPEQTPLPPTHRAKTLNTPARSSLLEASSLVPPSTASNVIDDFPDSPTSHINTTAHAAGLKGFITDVYAPRPRIHYVQLSPFEADLVLELSRPHDTLGRSTMVIQPHSRLASSSREIQQRPIASPSGLSPGVLGKAAPNVRSKPIGQLPAAALRGENNQATRRSFYSSDTLIGFVVGATVLNLLIALYTSYIS